MKATTPIRLMKPAAAVAAAEPAMPKAGIGPSPRISTGLRTRSMATLTIMKMSGVCASPAPRRPIMIMTLSSVAGIAMKMTRR